jgi:hypothetical protein
VQQDCPYMFWPLLAIIGMHSQHYKQIFYMYDEHRLSSMSITHRKVVIIIELDRITAD